MSLTMTMHAEYEVPKVFPRPFCRPLVALYHFLMINPVTRPPMVNSTKLPINQTKAIG
jgi:hypothetical protein